MKEKLVDIVIVNLNGKHHLETCLPSIENHSKSVPYQLVIVDNGSTDGSIEWVRSTFPTASMIENDENMGFSYACNQGIHASKGDYVLLLNNDTAFLNDVVTILVKFLEETPEAGLVGPLTLYSDGRLQASIKNFPAIWKYLLQQTGLPTLLGWGENLYYPFGPFREQDYQTSHEVEWLSGACLMFSRALYNKIGSLDEKMLFGLEDMDYARRTIAAGYRNYFVPDARIIHYKSGTHGTFSNQQRRYLLRAYSQGTNVYFQKHHSPLGYILVRLSMLLGNVLKMSVRRQR